MQHRAASRIDTVMGIAAPGRNEVGPQWGFLQFRPALADLGRPGGVATTPAGFAIAQMSHRRLPDSPPQMG